MRIGPLSVCAAFVVCVASLVAPAAADTPPPTLYVTGNAHGNNCSDTGPGSYAQPQCDVQTAANIVVPGQTVIVDAYGTTDDVIGGDIHITRSGTPGSPIVFRTGVRPAYTSNPSSVTIDSGTNGFVLAGVHDVTIDDFGVQNTDSTGIVVSNSGDIAINHDFLVSTPSLAGPRGDGIDVTGTSSNVVVSRSDVDAAGTQVSVGPGVSGTDIAANIFTTGNAVSVTGAANTDLTNNTADLGYCPNSVFTVAGAATGTSVENNILLTTCPAASPLLTVAADSTAGTKSDYNVVHAQGDSEIYSWGGTSYPSAAALAAATGQGTHDLNSDQPFSTGDMPAEASPAVDSADANAPGVLPTDHNGSPPLDDPLVTNTGTGIGYLDRGAVEMQDPMTLSVSLNAQRAPTGGTVVATLAATQGWAPITGYTVDFGDGTGPTGSTSPTISHVYTVAKNDFYQISATVADSLGHVTTVVPPLYDGVFIVPPAPLVPVVSAWQASKDTPLHVYADAIASQDSWTLTSATCDFGDGTGVRPADTSLGCDHTYQAAGTYRVTMTVTDAGGNTASGSQLLTARALPVVQPGPGRRCPTCY